jgi:glutamate-1-semialdehyde 2,1-aminomutase
MVKLAELLTKRINFADWAVFAKNGSDLTTWAVQVTREATGKSGILKVKGAYHGVDAWCTPGKGGIIEEDVSNVFSFQWNSEEDFDNAINKNLAKLAAVIITPYHHPVFADNEMPKEGFLQHIQKTCNKHGIILILDDVRAGFRLHTNGSHQHFGFKPDIACYCKALANGYPISAAAGIHSLKVPASRVFLTGSYWNDAVSMSAALKCLEIIERDNVPKKVLELGNLLKNGLENSAKKHGHDVIVSGPPSMPSMRFANETNFYQMQKFSSLCIQSGVFFHPHHNWFLSSAHTIEDIEEAISIAENVFSKIEVN